MREIIGDIWEYHNKGEYVAITTNGLVSRTGCLVMGRGTARQARDKFRGLDKALGDLVLTKGNVPFFIEEHRLVTFPVKHAWYEDADIELIKRSASLLALNWKYRHKNLSIYMGRPGCGNGNLKWKDVKPTIAPFLDSDQFVICELNP